MILDVESLFGVRGKVALVTGGSSGVGQMIATAFAASGVKVYITGRKQDRLDAAAAEIGALGECHAIACDLSVMSEIERLVDALAERESRLNILVNNAGASWSHPIDSYPEAGWDRVMGLNTKTPFFLTQKLLPLLSAAASDEDPARVINLSSVATISAGAVSAAYPASKAAVEQLTRTMARGFGDRRITANAISPGWFPSRMNAPLGDVERKAWVEKTPLGRLGAVEDMGGLAIFLCSRAGAYINGRTIVTDGGYSA
jgi:NAD(P)-dependent dehydrogenase (short-subunit alcohol dehydrogenase family)